ncbi:MAG: WYL domain-containing protein [Acidobacteria bacterium]|jgi:predicted DNA-binding transcriptional regulator YafY|nr:WYL domain-containing protein [Acidobacteriota bacterium]
MAKKLAYERYLWFHGRLQAKKYPKIADLAEKFEISRRQAAREIEFMRLFLEAPIEYSSEHSGYYYSRENFQFPGLWVSEEEIVSLVVARRLAAALPDRGLKRKFDLFLRKVSNDMDLDLLRLEEKVSLKNVRYTRVEPAVFSAVLKALVRERQLAITYAPGYVAAEAQRTLPQVDAGLTARTVDPLHLLVYMGNWHLIAWCHERRAVRDFLLSRVRQAEVLVRPVASPVKPEAIKAQIEERYGIFFAGPPIRVVLRFSGAGARAVREQVWFPGQESEEPGDGTLLLKFPVADFREVVRDILPFGGDAEVLEPPELRRLLAATIGKMAGVYRKK